MFRETSLKEKKENPERASRKLRSSRKLEKTEVAFWAQNFSMFPGTRENVFRSFRVRNVFGTEM